MIDVESVRGRRREGETYSSARGEEEREREKWTCKWERRKRGSKGERKRGREADGKRDRRMERDRHVKEIGERQRVRGEERQMKRGRQKEGDKYTC